MDAGLERLLDDLRKVSWSLKPKTVAEELADAAEEYVAFFERVAESPKLNHLRRRLQGLIKQVRGKK